MAKRSTKTTDRSIADASAEREVPLTGIEPYHPPQPNRAFLRTAVVVFVLWMGVLVWLAIIS